MSITLIILGSVFTLFILYGINTYRKFKNVPNVPESDKIRHLTDKNFQQSVRNGISLVDFWASWCMPCKMMTPVLSELAEETGKDVQICKVNVEQYQSLASKYAVRGIPTMLLFKNGKEIDRFIGVKSKDLLLKQISKIK